MNCRRCRTQQKDGFLNEVKCAGIEHVEECARTTDKVPKRSEENRRFWLLFEKMMPALVKHKIQLGIKEGRLAMFEWVEFDYAAIDHVLNNYSIPTGQRPIIYDKCIAVIKIIKKRKSK